MKSSTSDFQYSAIMGNTLGVFVFRLAMSEKNSDKRYFCLPSDDHSTMNTVPVSNFAVALVIFVLVLT